MPKPHAIMQRQIRERLQGVTGPRRIAEIKELLRELPPFTQGPYGTMRKRLEAELEVTRRKTKHSHRDSTYKVEKGGVFQMALVGAPNSGKSALFTALTGKYSKSGDFSYTTLGPVAGLFTLNDASFQVVDLPGIARQSADSDKHDSRLAEFVHTQRNHLWTIALDADVGQQVDLVRSVIRAPEGRKIIAVGTKSDIASGTAPERLRQLVHEFPSVCVSAVTGKGVEELRQLIYGESGLMRIFLRKHGQETMDAVHIALASTLRELVEGIHGNMARRYSGARVWGTSAKFGGQPVGLQHRLAPDDIVELHLHN